mmetsp:Transcript_3533/g.12909  ORF Transcript_3533/g.12909 Transcript_3533/m.12909 type:complete len:450 (+) Transcript_3533:84-1433(+)
MAWMVPGQNFDKYTYAAMLSAAKIAQAWSGAPIDENEEESRPPQPLETAAFDMDALLRLAQSAKEGSGQEQSPTLFYPPSPPPPQLAHLGRRDAAVDVPAGVVDLATSTSSSSAASCSTSALQPDTSAPSSSGPRASAMLDFASRDIIAGRCLRIPLPGFEALGSSASNTEPERQAGEAKDAGPKAKMEGKFRIADEALQNARRGAQANKKFYAAASEAPLPSPSLAQQSSSSGQVAVRDPASQAPALGELRAPVLARLRAHDMGMGDLGLRYLSPSKSRSRSRSKSRTRRRRKSSSKSRSRGGDHRRKRSRSRSGGRRRARIFSERPQAETSNAASTGLTGAATSRASAPVPQPDGGFAVNRVNLAPQAGALQRIDIQIPMALVRHFIGNKGATVRMITDAVGGGVSINVLPTVLPGGFKRIQVVGSNWYAAQTLILAKLEELRVSCW